MNNQDTLIPQYSSELNKTGIRGKYASRYRECTNIFLVQPDLHKLFSNSVAVNQALREFAEEHLLCSVDIIRERCLPFVGSILQLA